jgi:hypothetical protein
VPLTVPQLSPALASDTCLQTFAAVHKSPFDVSQTTPKEQFSPAPAPAPHVPFEQSSGVSHGWLRPHVSPAFAGVAHVPSSAQRKSSSQSLDETQSPPAPAFVVHVPQVDPGPLLQRRPAH